MVSAGTAAVLAGHAPDWSGKTMWSRWLAESMLSPAARQLGKVAIRITLLLPGQIGYLSVTRLVNPLQVHCAWALAGPLVAALASPVTARRNCGIALTLLFGFPLNCRVTCG